MLTTGNFTGAQETLDKVSSKFEKPTAGESKECMVEPRGLSVLLAGPHHRMNEAIRDLLATAFNAVIMVADEASLFESAGRLGCKVAVVDLALSKGNALEFVRRLHRNFPSMRIVVLSVHDQPSVSRSVLAAGARGFVLRRAIADDLLEAADAVLSGKIYVSSRVGVAVTGQQ